MGEKTLSQQVIFKKPTIKRTNRSYVRLFEYFATAEKWTEFLQKYRVELVPFGMHRNGDCAIRVIDRATNQLAVLGLDVPNEIKYHSYIATARSFWTEEFENATHRLHRIIEIGYQSAPKDEVTPK